MNAGRTVRTTARALLVGLIFLVAACAPQAGRGPAAGSATGQDEAQRPPKVLTLAIQNELKGFVHELTLENARVGGVRQPKPIVHNLLTVENDRAQFLPELAVEQISIEKGTWKLNPDRSMETTWRIHPNVKWHDGAPFTSDDLMFAFTVFTDPIVPNRVGPASKLMTSATAQDAHTLVVRWSAPYVGADAAPGLVPLPRHLLEEAYQADKVNIGNSPRLNTEFVGLGPYRLASWEPGSHVEFVRFDDYWRGRPPLDRVVVRFVGDPNTMVANILADAVDVVLPPAVDNETALEVKQRWQGTANQVLIGPRLSLRALDPQQRPEYARPVNGFIHSAVRKAFYHAIDRQTLTEVLTQGTAPVADSWVLPSDPIRPLVESSIPQYPFDLARARALLAEAGWAPGPDGVLTYQATGERFDVELNGTSQRRVEQELNIIADGWKGVGAQVSFHAIPPAFGADTEYRSTRTGPTVLARSADNFRTDYPHTKTIPTAQNRWAGNTYSGYSNPRLDALLDQLVVTVNPAERVPIEIELLKEELGDVPVWPLYWDTTNVLALKHVKGIPTGAGDYHTWNFYQWDRE
jgi:peptide/nickel transport system substrate-binding protein